jgi:hypothetical protein
MLYWTWKGTGTKKGKARKKEMKLRRRSSPYMTESAEIDHRRKLKEVGIEDEDKESMDEEQCQIFKNELSIHYD